MSNRINVNDDLPTLLGRNVKFLDSWANANEEVFEDVMRRLAEEKPEKWVDIYMRVSQTIAPSKENKNTTNINVKIDSDFDKLTALAGVAVPGKMLESQSNRTEYAKFEEIPS